MLDDEARERELSRMLAGLADSDTALAHARELLDVAQPGDAPTCDPEEPDPRSWDRIEFREAAGI